MLQQIPVPVVCDVSECGADGESEVVMFGWMICVAANDLSLSYVAYLNAEQMVRVKLRCLVVWFVLQRMTCPCRMWRI